MIDRLGSSLDANAQALKLRSERQKVLAANIANADTPNYKAMDFDFGKALGIATAHSPGKPTPSGPAAQLAGTGAINQPVLAMAAPGSGNGSAVMTGAGQSAAPSTSASLAGAGLLLRTDSTHLAGTLSTPSPEAPAMRFRNVNQPSIDGNTVDTDTEQARFADNTLRYEASLKFLNGQIKSLMSAITGQA